MDEPFRRCRRCHRAGHRREVLQELQCGRKDGAGRPPRSADRAGVFRPRPVAEHADWWPPVRSQTCSHPENLRATYGGKLALLDHGRPPHDAPTGTTHEAPDLPHRSAPGSPSPVRLMPMAACGAAAFTGDARLGLRRPAIDTATITGTAHRTSPTSTSGTSLSDTRIRWPGWRKIVDTLLMRQYNTRTVLLGTILLGIGAGTVGTFMLLRKRSTGRRRGQPRLAAGHRPGLPLRRTGTTGQGNGRCRRSCWEHSWPD